MLSKQWMCLVRIAFMAVLSLVILGGSAYGADLGTQLSEAESQIVSAQAEVAAAEAGVDTARGNLNGAAQRAAPVVESARSTQVDVRELRATLSNRQQRAKAQISELEAAHIQEVDDHDREIIVGVGIGLAALIGAGIALAWNRFRASATIAALSRIDLPQALGLCLGGGLLLLIVGAVFGEAEGIGGVLGVALFGLGFVLPTAFLFGRHSAQIQHGRAKPMLKRDRFPTWVSRSVAALLLLLTIGGLGSWIFAEEPAAFSPSAQLQGDRVALERGPDAEQLEEAATKAEAAREAAVKPVAQQQAARTAQRKATEELRRAKGLLVSAEADQRHFSRQLAILVGREEREAAKEAAQAEREAEEIAEEVAEESFSSECDPNYSGCVPAYPPDVDCAEVGETVTVVGSDPHGLDADGDLVGCE